MSISGTLPVPPYSELSSLGGDFVYFLYSSNGELLYIGQTGRLRDRLQAHYKNSQRQSLGYDNFTIEKMENRREAWHYEKELILKYKPPHNKLAGFEKVER